MSRSLGRSFVVLLCMAALVACGDDGPRRAGTHDNSSVTEVPQPTTGPYVSVAVDNHFHDIHPDDDIEIAGDRAFVVKNEGGNLHNVTINGTPISRDVRPGREFRLDPLGETLAPGVYNVTCKYHADQGMTGRFRVVPPPN